MPSEFDQYAAGYRELLRDPIRDRFAPGSAFFMQRKWILLRDFLERRGIVAGNWRWLDVGCGQGELLRLGKPYFLQAAGCDLSSQMLNEARDLDVRPQAGPATLPYETAGFDLVTAVCVYHHVVTDDLRRALTNEIRRVLRPGGVFCIIEHNPWNPATRLIVRRTPVDADARLLTASEAGSVLSAGGFRVVEKEFFLYLPEGLYRKVAFFESWMKRVPAGGQYAVFAEKRV